MADVCNRYLHVWRIWPPGSGWLLLENDLCLTYSTWPEQCQQGCLAAEGDIFRAWHPWSPLLWQWPTICECPVCQLLYILGHHTWNLKSGLPTIQWICWGMHQIHQTHTPTSQIQQCQSTSWLTSTLSYTHQHQASLSSRAVVPMLTQNNHSGQDIQQWPISHTLTHALKLLRHRLTNVAKHLHHCMLANQLQCMTPSEGFGLLLLWYMSYHGTAIKYTPAMVPHTATCRDTSVNAVSKQSTLSQVAQLPHCRLQQDTASQQHNLHCKNLHSICSPHLLHLQHWQLRWAKPQLSLPCQLFKRMPWHQCLWHPMPCLCSPKDLAVPAWHLDAWSMKSENFQPGLSMDLVIVMCCHIHPQSL